MNEIESLCDIFKNDNDVQELINDVVLGSNRYIELRTKHEELLKRNQISNPEEYRIAVSEADQLRSRAHNSLISSVEAVNRLCIQNGLERLANAADREDVARFAYRLVASTAE